MKTISFLFLSVFSVTTCFSQSSFDFSGNRLTIDNGSIKRSVSFSHDSVITESLFLSGSGRNFLRDKSPEFQFQLNGRTINGYSGWKVISCKPFSDNYDGNGAILKLTGAGPAEGIELDVKYLSYPGLPLIRKWISFTNRSSADMKLESLDIESLFLNIDYVSAWIYNNYARMKQLGTFLGSWDDPVVVIHNTTLRAGIALGNETPGVLKRTAYHTSDRNAEIGLTHTGQDFPFRKWLESGETWESPKVFIALYSGTDNGFNVINTVVNDYVRKHLGSRISTIEDKPLFVYNTWYPFRTFVSDSLIREVAMAASECGVQEFIIDDGWQYNQGKRSSDKGWGGNYGDWLIDRKKFPEGLASTFSYIRSLGMKPGLWISIGAATADSRVFQTHPEWFVVNQDGKPGNLHTSWEAPDFYTSCYGTEWISYIKSVILNLVKEHGLAYAKLDFSIATSAYINDPGVSGCYATNHLYHRDHEESFIVIYENVLKLFDELHAEAPGLFIDCTFETVGKLQMQDYAFAKHAEGNWLSNIEEPFPTGALRMRQMAWWRSPAVPAGSLVIGNLPLDSKDLEFDLQSLIGTLPIMLGDPRKLSQEMRSHVRKWADWMVRMQKTYDYMSFRQDLPGFGEPAEGSWDGWARINTERKNGGIIGVFRQGAGESTRKVIIDYLDPAKEYQILQAPEDKLITVLTGHQLSTEGFQVAMEKNYDGEVFEIRQTLNQP